MHIPKTLIAAFFITPLLVLSACDKTAKQTQNQQTQSPASPQNQTQIAQQQTPAQTQNQAQPATANQQNIEVGFSPEGTAQQLILKVIDSSKQSIFVSAYSYTSPVITRHLIEASKRGVAVWLVVDMKNNLVDNSKKGATSALNALVSAGAKVRVNANYAIHHDKVLISDRATVQTGSFNYSSSANDMNSENVIVIWQTPAVAEQYYAHWYARYQEGQDYVPKY